MHTFHTYLAVSANSDLLGSSILGWCDDCKVKARFRPLLTCTVALQVVCQYHRVDWVNMVLFLLIKRFQGPESIRITDKQEM